MCRPFSEVCYNQVVPRQLLLNKPLYCAPFPKEKVAFARLSFIKQLLMNCKFILGNIINSKLALFSARYVVKVEQDASSSTSFEGDSLSICVDRLRS